MAQALSLSSTWAVKGPTLGINNVVMPSNASTLPQTSPPNHLLLSLAPSPSSIPPVTAQENPTTLLQCNLRGGAHEVSSPAFMVYQCADPTSFIPDTFQWVDVPNWEFMSRAVAPMRPPATNEDLAIVTFDPLPGNVLNFVVVRNIIRDFLIGHHVVPHAVLPCHLGQSFVRFHHAYERDNMVR